MTTLTAIKTLIKGNYNIEVFEKFETLDNGRPSYKVICQDINTDEVVEEMSDTVYLSMNAVNEFIKSIKKTKQPRKEVNSIKFDDLMKVMKKYVSKSETRPVLKMVQFSNGYFTATDSHHLIRVNSQYVSDIPVDITEGCLYNPKEMIINSEQMKYPDTSRLIPQYSESTVLLNKQNMKEFEQEIKAIKKLTTERRNKVVKMEFGQLGTIISGKEFTVEGTEPKTHKAIMKNLNVEGKELTINAADNYLLTALDSVKKLSKFSQDHIEMRMNGHLRPIVFTQYNVFDVIVLPVRTY